MGFASRTTANCCPLDRDAPKTESSDQHLCRLMPTSLQAQLPHALLRHLDLFSASAGCLATETVAGNWPGTRPFKRPMKVPPIKSMTSVERLTATPREKKL